MSVWRAIPDQYLAANNRKSMSYLLLSMKSRLKTYSGSEAMLMVVWGRRRVTAEAAGYEAPCTTLGYVEPKGTKADRYTQCSPEDRRRHLMESFRLSLLIITVCPGAHPTPHMYQDHDFLADHKTANIKCVGISLSCRHVIDDCIMYPPASVLVASPSKVPLPLGSGGSCWLPLGAMCPRVTIRPHGMQQVPLRGLVKLF